MVTKDNPIPVWVATVFEGRVMFGEHYFADMDDALDFRDAQHRLGPSRAVTVRRIDMISS